VISSEFAPLLLVLKTIELRLDMLYIVSKTLASYQTFCVERDVKLYSLTHQDI